MVINKKTFIISGLSILVALGIVWGGVFYWQNLRGVGPSLESPPQDIVKIIENQKPSTGQEPAATGAQNGTNMPLKMPPGFSISIFAKDLKDPRVMIFDANSNMLVSIPSEGKVVALPDGDVNGVADRTVVVAQGLNKPHGLAIRCEGPMAMQKCYLYVGEMDQISKYDYDASGMTVSNKTKIADLPSGGNHVTRTLGFGPDDRLYVSIGSSCNVCNEEDQRRARIFSMNPDGSDFKEFARGLRNAVFFTWHPTTKKMWTTEMGRDLLGDNIPPDEINIVESGKNYGWPNCYGKNIHDDNFDKNVYIRNPCMEPFETPSYIDVPAHSAPLGLAFVPMDTSLARSDIKSSAWPEDYWYNMFVAYHGSWNRSVPTGYKIVRYKLDVSGNYQKDADGNPVVEDFMSGWLTPSGALGRPVDILVLPGGYMYVTDDKAGVVYRIFYDAKI
jgi:glucose/arabinose dehydrogenase